jgi:hypothetical protein
LLVNAAGIVAAVSSFTSAAPRCCSTYVWRAYLASAAPRRCSRRVVRRVKKSILVRRCSASAWLQVLQHSCLWLLFVLVRCLAHVCLAVLLGKAVEVLLR